MEGVIFDAMRIKVKTQPENTGSERATRKLLAWDVERAVFLGMICARLLECRYPYTVLYAILYNTPSTYVRYIIVLYIPVYPVCTPRRLLWRSFQTQQPEGPKR